MIPCVSSLVFIRTKSKPFTKAWRGLILAPPSHPPVSSQPITMDFLNVTYWFSLQGFCTTGALCLLHSSYKSSHLAFIHSGLRLNVTISELSLLSLYYHSKPSYHSTISPCYSFLVAFVTSEITLFPYLLIISLYHHQTPPISRVPWEHVLFTALSLAPRILQGTQ